MAEPPDELLDEVESRGAKVSLGVGEAVLTGTARDWKLRLGVTRVGDGKGPVFGFSACLLLIFRSSDVLRLLSVWSRFCRRCRIMLRLANLPWRGSRFRPPVLMDVFSSGVERRVTCSPPDSSSCNTCIKQKILEYYINKIGVYFEVFCHYNARVCAKE